MTKTMRQFASAALVLCASTWLAACNGPVPVNPRVPPVGSNAAFSEAYIYGCESGSHDANPSGYVDKGSKDLKRYASDVDYKKGWDQGQAACYEDELKAPVMQDVGGGGGGNI
jgi:hypothetical protein